MVVVLRLTMTKSRPLQCSSLLLRRWKRILWLCIVKREWNPEKSCLLWGHDGSFEGHFEKGSGYSVSELDDDQRGVRGGWQDQEDVLKRPQLNFSLFSSPLSCQVISHCLVEFNIFPFSPFYSCSLSFFPFHSFTHSLIHSFTHSHKYVM